MKKIKKLKKVLTKFYNDGIVILVLEIRANKTQTSEKTSEKKC